MHKCYFYTCFSSPVQSHAISSNHGWICVILLCIGTKWQPYREEAGQTGVKYSHLHVFKRILNRRVNAFLFRKSSNTSFKNIGDLCTFCRILFKAKHIKKDIPSKLGRRYRLPGKNFVPGCQSIGRHVDAGGFLASAKHGCQKMGLKMTDSARQELCCYSESAAVSHNGERRLISSLSPGMGAER